MLDALANTYIRWMDVHDETNPIHRLVEIVLTDIILVATFIAYLFGTEEAE